jgi:hypothetical protein
MWVLCVPSTRYWQPGYAATPRKKARQQLSSFSPARQCVSQSITMNTFGFCYVAPRIALVGLPLFSAIPRNATTIACSTSQSTPLPLRAILCSCHSLLASIENVRSFVRLCLHSAWREDLRSTPIFHRLHYCLICVQPSPLTMVFDIIALALVLLSYCLRCGHLQKC